MSATRYRLLVSALLISGRTRASFLPWTNVDVRRSIFTWSSTRTRRLVRSNQNLHQLFYGASELDALPPISITDNFDGGNIEFLQATSNEGGNLLQVTLRIKPDMFTELEQKAHFQYFAFRSTVNDLTASDGTLVKYVIENAGEASYSVAWKGTTIFFSNNMSDTNSWRRKLDTQYEGETGKLTWTHKHTKTGPVYFCYFPPFSYNQHLDLVSKSAEYGKVFSLGKTLEGREIDCISVGKGERVCWIVHRQHPGEPMAEYFAEGLLTRLLGLDSNGEVDGLVCDVLKKYSFYIVPCMCPDGAVRGALRTNAAGANLNREWANSGDYKAPSLERSPEVYAVLSKMEETGVDVFVDVHGDEELPYNFLSGAEETKNWGPRLKSLHGTFVASYIRANSDMQAKFGYSPPAPGEAMENIGTNAIADRFDCLSVTLEMPFKDCQSNPDPERGWSPNRAKKLGASILDPLSYIHPYIRGELWKGIPKKDAYVTPTDRYQEIR